MTPLRRFWHTVTGRSADSEPYEAPRPVHRLSECQFYHTMDLPRHGVVEGLWDLRDSIDDYLGDVDYSGKRVLDVGTASGFLTFEMEKRGAEVVSFDAQQWEEVPYRASGPQLARRRGELDRGLELLKNGYWLAHGALGSNARVHYGDIYNLPEVLGAFDVAVIGMVLGHLRDPMLALRSVCRLMPREIVVVEGTFDDPRPVAYFAPDADTRQPTNIWWSMSETCIRRMLEVFGFRVAASAVSHRANLPDPTRPERAHRSQLIPATTLTGRRD